MAKVLISPDFGAGWSTWCHGPREQREFMLTYAPLIEAIETGGDQDAALNRFQDDFRQRFGEDADMPYLGGARDLCVEEVHGPFRVHEYDGSEDLVPITLREYYEFPVC